ncbi:hypothetical protein [Streptomyces sp. NPDC094049]|uniref:hypothetical protein n=1 Tax=Streptomyces sp. NPDC094049 TaxID=3154987 RepID=UPI0033172EF4
MTKQTLVWTLLPDPAVPAPGPGVVPLSLVLSVRLSNDQGNPPGTAVLPLSDYPDVADWPAFSFQPLTVIVKKPDDTSITPIATLTDSPVDAALWRALFPPSLPVQPFVFGTVATHGALQAFPTATLGRALSEVYAGLLAAGPDWPGPGGALPASPGWDGVDRLIQRVGTADTDGSDGALHRALLRAGVLPDDDALDPEGWQRLADFHRPLCPEPAGGQAASFGRGAQGPYEFHALLGALADHPGLMAPLGLVRRLTITVPGGLEGPVTLQAVPHQNTFTQNYRPRTRCVAHAGTLALADPDGSAGATVLPLDDTTVYTPLDLDVDAGGLALRSYTATLNALPRDEPPPPPQPPALRSAGIFVAETDRQVTFQGVLEAAARIDEDLSTGGEGDAVTMDSSTVQQGIRVDVLDEGSGHWYPLCRRTGQYTVTGYGTLPIDDEGTLTDAVTSGTDEQGNSVRRLPQTLFRWHNWSLTARPHGRAVGIDGEVTDPAPQRGPGLPFTAEHTCPDGTLPSLRYGRTYRFRARLVDLAGRSLPFTRDPGTGERTTTPLTLARYDPVPAPVLVLRRPVGAGESPAGLVVRTDNADPGAPLAGPACERHLLAPKAALELIDRHGVLDLPGKNRTDPAVHTLLTTYDAGKVTGTPDPGSGGSPYTDTLALPWLPDPLGRGVALHGVPGTPELLTDWPAGSPDWYARLPMRLVVEAGPMNSTVSTAVADTSARTITVVLAPAADFPAALSSLLAAGDEELLRAWNWYVERTAPSAADLAAARTAARSGLTGQLTPATDLTFVHAVRCPVSPPAFGGPQILREPGQTVYVLDDPAMSVHGASTLTVHTEASWTDTTDDPTQDGPGISASAAVLRPDSEPLSGPGGPALTAVPFRTRHDPGDTRHQVVTYTPVGASRFVPYFLRQATANPTRTTAVTVAPGGFVPGTVTVRESVAQLTADGAPAPAGTTYRDGTDYTTDDTAGTITLTGGSLISDGATVEVVYAEPPVTRGGPQVTLQVPSTVVPPVPVVHSVVPAFHWTRTTSGNKTTSIRQEGWVRVLLKRPWYATGDGELLGVRVVDPATPTGDPAAVGWATAWGHDPIRGSGDAPALGYPDPTRLDGYTADVGLGTDQGHALGYRPDYDPVRKLWCADIRFKANSAGNELYQPFVHLKVVRLQPDSLTAPDDLRMSPEVDAGFVQLPAYRRAQIVVGGTTTGSPVTVTVVGPVPPPGPEGLASQITAVVQFRSLTLLDDVGWLTLDTPGPTVLCLDPVSGPVGVWTGGVTLPNAVGVREMRVLIREYDIRDTGSPVGDLGSGRITYLDTLPILPV